MSGDGEQPNEELEEELAELANAFNRQASMASTVQAVLDIGAVLKPMVQALMGQGWAKDNAEQLVLTIWRRAL